MPTRAATAMAIQGKWACPSRPREVPNSPRLLTATIADTCRANTLRVPRIHRRPWGRRDGRRRHCARVLTPVRVCDRGGQLGWSSPWWQTWARVHCNRMAITPGTERGDVVERLVDSGACAGPGLRVPRPEQDQHRSNDKEHDRG